MSTILGRYRLLGELPMLGVCKRWLGYSEGTIPSLVVATALPRSLTNHAGTRERLEYRATAAEYLDLPPVLTTVEWGVERGCLFVVEELAYGESLEAILRAAEVGGKHLPLKWIVRWGTEAALALHAASISLDGQGYALGHGGLDPRRLYIGHEGRVRVGGYALGDVVHYTNQRSRGQAFPQLQRFEAPEQEELGTSVATGATTDCYQLGLILRELTDGPVPDKLDAVLRRATDPLVEERWGDLRAFAGSLQRCSLPDTSIDQSVALDDVVGSRMQEWADLASAMEGGDYGEAFEAALELMTTTPADLVSMDLADTLVRATPPPQQAPPHQTTEESTRFGGIAAGEPQSADLDATLARSDHGQDGTAERLEIPETADTAKTLETVDTSGVPPEDSEPELRSDSEVLDDEYERFYEPFDADLLVSPPPRELSPSEAGTSPVVEIIRTVDERVLGSTTLRGKTRNYVDAGHNVRVRRADDHAEIKIDPNFVTGSVGSQTTPAEPIPRTAELRLEPGQFARLDDQGVVHHVRVFYPPSRPAQDEPIVDRQEARLYAITIAASVVFHALVLIGVVLTASFGIELTVKEHEPVEVFAEGRLEKKKEKPEPKKKKEPPKPKKKKPTRKLAEKKPADPSDQKAKIPKSVRKKLKRRLSEKETSKDAGENLLAALKSPVSGKGETVKDVVSNIDAPNKGSKSAAFKVAGTLKALEGKDVNVATGGGGKLGDIGGQVDKGTGKLKRRKSSGKVRGKVSTVKALAKVEGSLARGDVYKEINKHLGRIQACYENELLKSPGIAGKITFEWTVKRDGHVRGVREISSTVGKKAVSKCVQGVIRRMKFPRPKGGEVTIRYPFIFRSSN